MKLLVRFLTLAIILCNVAAGPILWGPNNTTTNLQELGYTPGDAGNWAIPPTNVGQALDDVAERGYSLKPTAAEVFTVQTVDDVACSLNSTYFTYGSPEIAEGQIAWYNCDDGGVDPGGLGENYEIVISSGDTAATIATSTAAGIDDRYICIAESDVVTCTSTSVGEAVNVADGPAATGFTFDTQVDGTSAYLSFITANGTNHADIRTQPEQAVNTTLYLPATNPTLGDILYATDGIGTLGWTPAGVSLSSLNGILTSYNTNPKAYLVCHADIESLSGTQTCDGQTTGTGFVLMMSQVDVTENGLWLSDDFGAWTRPGTFPSSDSVPGSIVSVTEQGLGTNYSDTLWFGIGDGSSVAAYRNIPITSSNDKLIASRVVVTDSNSFLTTEAALSAAKGGTGVANNAAETITMVGDDAITFTTSNTTSVTLPTSGTLSTLAGDGTNASQATAHTLTAASAPEIFIASPGSAINQDLPTTNVKQGRVFALNVTGATTTNTVTLRSSGANTIDLIAGSGRIQVVALQDTPTTAAHWGVLSVSEYMTTSATSAGLTANASVTFYLTRNNKQALVTYTGVGTGKTKDGANGPIEFTTVLPTRFRPASTDQGNLSWGQNTTGSAIAAVARTNGDIEVYKMNATTGDAENWAANQTPIGWGNVGAIPYNLQ